MQTAFFIATIIAAVAFVARQYSTIRKLESKASEQERDLGIVAGRVKELIRDCEQMTRNRDYWKKEALRLHNEALERDKPFEGLARLGSGK